MSSYKILISSVSAKVPMIQAVAAGFRQLDSMAEVIGADADENCIGKHFVADFWHMPLLNNLTIQTLIKYCKSIGITHIIPSRDAELSFYAQYKEPLQEAGIATMIGNQDTIETCLDKLQFYEQLTDKFPVIKTTLETDTEQQSWVVKERFGSGSHSLALDVDLQSANNTASQLQQAVYQPFISGKEYSVDLYFSAMGDCIGNVVRSRDVIENGESVKTTSVIDNEISELAIEVGQYLKLYGHNLIQIIKDGTGKLHIIEVNPRYGGASGLSVALGLKSFYWFGRESAGLCLQGQVLDSYQENKQLIKYKQERVIQLNDH